jgi:hypothetical protein
MNDFTHDPVPDPELAIALRDLEQAPYDEVDWGALHRSITERAELPLARRRLRPRRRWGSRVLVPAAAAAGLILAIGIQVVGPAPGSGEDLAGVPAANGLRTMVEEVLGSAISDAELDVLLGDVSTDGLVIAAVTDW